MVPAAVAASLQFSQVIFGHLIGITLLREPVTLGGALGLVPVGAGVGVGDVVLVLSTLIVPYWLKAPLKLPAGLLTPEALWVG